MYLDKNLRWTGEMPGDLRLVFHQLKRHDLNAYIVGPAVRDALVNGTMERVQRVDLLIDAASISDAERALTGVTAPTLSISKPERVRRGFTAFLIRNRQTGGTIRRLVISSSGGHGLTEELSKREVTINAVAMDSSQTILDPLKGLKDLESQTIRPIDPPAVAFTTRPLSLVKIAKHIAYHGFASDKETEEAATRFSSNILDVSPERIRPELERLLVNLYPDKGLDFLQRTGILKYILPEVEMLVGFEDSCEVHHKDIWDHTKKVVCQSKPTAVIRWSALFHDIGKVWTRSVDEAGKVHFFRHEELGATLFRGIAFRLGLEEHLMKQVEFLIRNHSRVNMYTTDWTDPAVRRLIRDMGESLDDLLALSRADITSKQERRVNELIRLLDELESRIRSIRELDARQPLLPKGTGNVIMKHFGIPPGPLVGTLKSVLEKAVEERRLASGLPVEEYMPFLEEYVRTQGK